MGKIWGEYGGFFKSCSPIFPPYGGYMGENPGVPQVEAVSKQFSSFCFSQGVKSATDRGRLAPCSAISPRRFLQRGNARLKCSSQTTKGAVRVPTATFFKSE